MISRIAVYSKVPDTRNAVRLKTLKTLFPKFKLDKIEIVDIYTVDKKLSENQLESVAEILINPVTEYSKIRVENGKTFVIAKQDHGGVIASEASQSRLKNNLSNQDSTSRKSGALNDISFDFAIEIGFLPGVTDNVGNTTKQSAQDHLKIKFSDDEGIYSSQVIFITGKLSLDEVTEIVNSFINPLIQRVSIKSAGQYQKDSGMDFYVPKVKLVPAKAGIHTDYVDLNVPDEELKKIGKLGIKNEDGSRRGPLALDLDYLKTIQTYFKLKKRNPTDIELETLAQTWSEHCKHTIFADPIDDVKDGLFKTYIKGATEKINKKDFTAKVFNDNSGAINFDDDFLITHKVETHNTPSALDPFGGAITGIVGVNRDAIGFGLGAKPIFNTYGFMVGDPEDEEPIFKDKLLTQKMLSPKRILEGVVSGINAGGNQSGIPTPTGFLYFDDRYKGKPLVFAGTVGLIPKKIGDKSATAKKAEPGDLVVMVGGKVGADGIHGATFSSEGLGADSPSTAVQIGDPITQKKFSDAIIKEARDKGFYDSITDCGAGGLSSSVGEMARESGGVEVDLEKVPLKYSGLSPWQIWISESQERMVLSIPQNKWKEFEELMKSRGVDAWEIGKFTDSGKCEIKFKGKTILDLDLEFLHEGLPVRKQETRYKKQNLVEPKFAEPEDMGKIFLEMMGRLNISSFEFISKQYDHTVQGTAVTYPLAGRGRVNVDSTVVRPLLTSQKGLVLSQGFYPSYSDIDTYWMAAASIDTAFKNAIISGANPDKIALLDNFCWASSNEPESLFALKRANEALYDFAVSYKSPYISGKDSMFNDFNGFDEKGNSIKISVPYTLLISSIGIVENIEKIATPDFKISGDLIYVLGETNEELGGSEYYKSINEVGNSVPKVDADKNLKLYLAYAKALEKGLIALGIGLGIGGLSVALAKSSLAGMIGASIDLSKLEGNVKRNDFALFSESQGRILVSVDPKRKLEFEKIMEGNSISEIGEVVDSKKIEISNSGKNVVNLSLDEVYEKYAERFKDW